MTAAPGQGRSGRGVAVIVVASLTASVLLGALGVWQVKRLFWKLDLIERVEKRVAAEPVAALTPTAFDRMRPQSAEYLKVRVAGRFRNDKETLVQAVTDLGGGYWVLTPLDTAQGFTVLVNRGFVPAERRDPATRGEDAGKAVVTGLVRLSEPGGAFLRENDPARDRWYSRDVGAIASARGLGTTAPYFIDADAAPNTSGLPVGGLTRVHFANNHLAYALTWFSLALMALGGGGYVLHDWRRSRHARSPGTRTMGWCS